MVKYLCLSVRVHVLVHGYVSVTDLPAVSSLRQHACLNAIRHQFQRQLSQRPSPSPLHSEWLSQHQLNSLNARYTTSPGSVPAPAVSMPVLVPVHNGRPQHEVRRITH